MAQGFLQRDLAYPNRPILIIPVDIVVNAIFVSTAYVASLPNAQVQVFHVSSAGVLKDKTMNGFFDDCFDYVKFHPWETAIQKPNGYVVSETRRDFNRKQKVELAIQAAKVKLAGLPLIGSKKKKAKEMKKLKLYMMYYNVATTVLGFFRWRRSEHACDNLLALTAHLD